MVGSKKYQGNYKSVEPSETEVCVNGIYLKKYGYQQAEGRFERENISYKFIVKNAVEDETGNVRQIQLELGKIDWSVIDSPGDAYAELLSKKKIDFIKETFGPSEYDLAQLLGKIDAEVKHYSQTFRDLYHASEEYAVAKQNKKRINQWIRAKFQFEKEFGTGYFEQIYDFDLQLRNPELLEQLKRKKYQTGGGSTRSDRDYSNAGSQPASPNSTAYSDEEKDYLKKFYKTLAKSYHPDVSDDDGKAMQLLNKLKEQWKL